MANYCNYEVHVKGTKKAVLMVYASMPAACNKYITFGRAIENDYIIHFRGDCRWSLDAYCKPTRRKKIDLSKIDENNFDEEYGLEYWYITLKDKSRLLRCEIEAHAWSKESCFDGFEHYKDGVEIRKEYVEWPGTVHLEWDKEYFPTHEEFCEAFGIDPDEFCESLFMEDEDGIFVYHDEAEQTSVEFSFDY